MTCSVEGDRTPRRWPWSLGLAGGVCREALASAPAGAQGQAAGPCAVPRRGGLPQFFRGRAPGLFVELSHQGSCYRILRMFLDVPRGVGLDSPRAARTPSSPPRVVATPRGSRAARIPPRRPSAPPVVAQNLQHLLLQRRPEAPSGCPGRRLRRGAGALRALTAIGRPARDRVHVRHRLLSVPSRATRRRTASTACTARALPIAQGIKLANPDLPWRGGGGDGDGFSIGGGTCRTPSAATSTSPTS